MGEQSGAKAKGEKLYHERQVRELCALHALNNLLQSKQAFTKKDLDEICNRLSPGSFINPHRSMLGLGNYDVNVLMAALQQKGYETIWFDKRKDVEVLLPSNIMGFILNMPMDFKLGFVKFRRKHWIAIRWLQGQYMNLDSKLDAPLALGDTASLVKHLRAELSDGDKELFLVVEQEVYEASTWRRQSQCSSRVAGSTANTATAPTSCGGVNGGCGGSKLDTSTSHKEEKEENCVRETKVGKDSSQSCESEKESSAEVKENHVGT